MTLAAPFPYFGGKRRAAPIIWQALGDPGGYIEPFAGSAAVLLARPQFTGRRVETINDADGWLVNMWRSIQHDPAAVAQHCAGPVTEIDYHARLAWLQERRTDDLVTWLEGDPEVFDAKAAGWWLYVTACGIGDPWGRGPWRVVDGRLRDTRKLPHLGDAGQGVNRELPHLGDAGKGIQRALPHLGDAGQVNRSSYEPGAHEQQIARYLDALAERLARVRITCGSWERVVKPSVTRPRTGGDSCTAILLDPPYSTSGDLYAGTTDASVAEEVRAWCITAKDPSLRIILCGYNDEHQELESHGWRMIEGKAGSGSGYSTRRDNGRRERLWLSPSCIRQGQDALFGMDGDA